MKQKILFSFIIMSFMITTISCTNVEKNQALTKTDSLNIGNDLLKKGMLKHYHKFQKINYTLTLPYRIANRDSVTKMISCYKNNPLIYDPTTSTYVEYFLMDEADWKALLTLHQSHPIKSFQFQLGIKNFNEVNNNDDDPEYTLITMTIDKSTGQTSLDQAYDYICPCPGSPCCPK